MCLLLWCCRVAIWPPFTFPCTRFRSTQFLSAKFLCFGFASTNHVARNHIDRNVYGPHWSSASPSSLLKLSNYKSREQTPVFVYFCFCFLVLQVAQFHIEKSFGYKHQRKWTTSLNGGGRVGLFFFLWCEEKKFEGLFLACHYPWLSWSHSL